jgi:riboflavin kinase/FMN adenylyltransferase
MQRGRTPGFPTANLHRCRTLIPAPGVYSGRVQLDRTHPAAVHIGPNPTFGEGVMKVEVHLLDFSGDLYGQSLSVDLLNRIRGVVKFASKEDLLRQLTNDCEQARIHVARAGQHAG